MRRIALAEALIDFGEPERAGIEPALPFLPEHFPGAAEPAPVRDEEDRLAAEIARAEAAVIERLERLHSEALEAERALRRTAVEDSQKQLGHEFGQLLAMRLDRVQQDLSGTITDLVSRILAPVLTEDLQRRMVAQLGDEIMKTLAGGDTLRLKVSGPAVFFEALAASLGPQADRLDFTETDGPDLTIACDEQVIETRLGDWGRSLVEAMS